MIPIHLSVLKLKFTFRCWHAPAQCCCCHQARHPDWDQWRQLHRQHHHFPQDHQDLFHHRTAVRSWSWNWQEIQRNCLFAQNIFQSENKSYLVILVSLIEVWSIIFSSSQKLIITWKPIKYIFQYIVIFILA